MKNVSVLSYPSKNMGKTPILINPTIGEVLYLYMACTDKAASVILVVDREGKQRLIY